MKLVQVLSLLMASSTVAAEETDVNIDHGWKVRVDLNPKPDSKVQVKQGNDHRKDYYVPEDVQEWKNEENMCWVSQAAK